MSKYVNIRVVNALLTLRGVSLKQLAEVTGVSLQALSAWLEGTAKDNDERLPFDRQLEVIKVLGVVGDHPRSDVTHNWYIREPAFGDRMAAYQPLRTILLCFGRCEVTPIYPERDPYFSLTARSYFGLTFEKFRAVLEVTFSPFRSLAFDPNALQNMHWVGEQAPLIVTEETFFTLVTPGEATPSDIDQARIQALAPARWAKLAELAEERGMGAAELARYLIENVPVQPALEHKKEAERKEDARQQPQPPADQFDLFFTPSAAEASSQ